MAILQTREVSALTAFQISKFSSVLEKIAPMYATANERTGNYLNHPDFGLLYSMCHLCDNTELFTTLYGTRIFFLVINSDSQIKFESIGRQEARLLVEKRLCDLRRLDQYLEYEKLIVMYQQTFLGNRYPQAE